MRDRTILGFCWNKSTHVEFYLPLISNLEEKGIKFCFITAGYTAKKGFIGHGIEAFAYRDILTRDLQRNARFDTPEIKI